MVEEEEGGWVVSCSRLCQSRPDRATRQDRESIKPSPGVIARWHYLRERLALPGDLPLPPSPPPPPLSNSAMPAWKTDRKERKKEGKKERKKKTFEERKHSKTADPLCVLSIKATTRYGPVSRVMFKY